jgi:hypothetical protein
MNYVLPNFTTFSELSQELTSGKNGKLVMMKGVTKLSLLMDLTCEHLTFFI